MENFNSLSLEFCNDIINTFPELKDKVLKTKELLEENTETQSYLEYYIKHTFPYMATLSKMELPEGDVKVMVGLSLKDIFEQSENNLAIWKYIYSLYLTAIETDEFDEIIEKCSEHRNYDKIQYTLRKSNRIQKNILASSGKIAEEMMKKMAENTDGKVFGEKFMDDKDFENKFLNSALGNLAKEISEEINPADLEGLKDPSKLLSEGLNGDGLGKIIQSVGEKLQGKLSSGDLDEGKLMGEAQNMMQTFAPMMQEMMKGMGGGGAGGKGGLDPMSMLSSMMGGGGLADMMGGGKKKKSKKKNRKNRPAIESVGEDVSPPE